MTIQLHTHDSLAHRHPLPDGAPLPLHQASAYAEAMRGMGADVVRLDLMSDHMLVGWAYAVRRRFLGLAQITSVMRGPIWCTDDPDLRAEALKALKQESALWRWRAMMLMPEAPDTPDVHDLMARAGLRRIMTGFSTVWQDLRGEDAALRAGLKSKWRNQLKRAEAEAITLNASHKSKHYDWLLEREAEQRLERRYQAVPTGLVPAYQAAGGANSVLALTAHHKGAKIAGALFLLHGTSATYHIGWSGAAGRALNAQNLVLWESLLELKARGIDFLDLGGLDSERLAGLARFKLGLGGAPLTLAGSFL